MRFSFLQLLEFLACAVQITCYLLDAGKKTILSPMIFVDYRILSSKLISLGQLPLTNLVHTVTKGTTSMLIRTPRLY